VSRELRASRLSRVTEGAGLVTSSRDCGRVVYRLFYVDGEAVQPQGGFGWRLTRCDYDQLDSSLEGSDD